MVSADSLSSITHQTLAADDWPENRQQLAMLYINYYTRGNILAWIALMNATTELDSYAIFTTTIPPNIVGIGNNVFKIIPESERFSLVSSFYGPGNCICWFLLLVSVAINQTADTMTNDPVAAITFPVVAVGDYIYLVLTNYSDMANGGAWSTPITSDVQFVASIEAPLIICEAFIARSALLYLLSARKGHIKRMTIMMIVTILCLLVEYIHAVIFKPKFRSTTPSPEPPSPEPGFTGVYSALLVGNFLFQLTPVFIGIFCWSILTMVLFVVEVIFKLCHERRDRKRRDLDEDEELKEIKKNKNWLWPGRITSFMSGCLAVVVGLASVEIKYGTAYPPKFRFHRFRYIPKGSVSMADMDQAIALWGRLMTLMFSLRRAWKGSRTTS
ncbi:hypothetical protein QBC38DRAFT_505066 [Podospora fimiseda]|uniref:Uncharacterized protein n=1 Tax=Podospora fimiseda TaxID=252190 RepID=A0AAN6YL11_9PEZI|nr:hypothetical protein QBC38DRAFT_505066 [Podospora fimiseda]